LPFAKAVTESVWRNHEEYFERSISVLIDAESDVLFYQPIQLQFIEGGFSIINFKETSFLGRVASILR